MAANEQIHLYGAIEKFDACDDGSLLVSGIASSESVDADGEIITADAMREALPSYLQKGTVREMHQPLAAGVPISAHVDDEGKTHFTARIVDVGTIAKIKAGVLKGFSIGGKSLKKIGNKITKLLLKDISVVDIPNNPLSYFSIVKFDNSNENKSMKSCKHCDEPVEKCGGKCDGAMAEKKKFDQIDSIASTVETLVKGFETLQKSVAESAKLEKALADIGDLQKKSSEAQAQIQSAERHSIITKMDAEGRVAMNPETGVAYKADELEKMDLPMLKFAARNSPVVPTSARANLKNNLKKVDDSLKGSDRVIAATAQYDNLDALLQTPMGSTVTA